MVLATLESTKEPPLRYFTFQRSPITIPDTLGCQLTVSGEVKIAPDSPTATKVPLPTVIPHKTIRKTRCAYYPVNVIGRSKDGAFISYCHEGVIYRSIDGTTGHSSKSKKLFDIPFGKAKGVLQ